MLDPSPAVPGPQRDGVSGEAETDGEVGSASPVARPAAELRADARERPRGEGTWVVLPTYDEAENIATIARAILGQLPAATLLVVDDGSPDGTGQLADDLARHDRRIRVRHRSRKQGLGRAYLDGFGVALAEGAASVVQMDADWSHDPAALPGLLAALELGKADLVIGSRYTRGGRVTDWGIGRRLVSRSGSLFARVVLGLPVHDLTGGFKAWRASTLAGIPFDGVHAGGYVFQIEMTHRARLAGARIIEVPITFRDRRVGASKMSRRIIAEALLVVVRLRWEGSVARRGVHGAAGDVPAASSDARSVGGPVTDAGRSSTVQQPAEHPEERAAEGPG